MSGRRPIDLSLLLGDNHSIRRTESTGNRGRAFVYQSNRNELILSRRHERLTQLRRIIKDISVLKNRNKDINDFLKSEANVTTLNRLSRHLKFDISELEKLIDSDIRNKTNRRTQNVSDALKNSLTPHLYAIHLANCRLGAMNTVIGGNSTKSNVIVTCMRNIRTVLNKYKTLSQFGFSNSFIEDLNRISLRNKKLALQNDNLTAFYNERASNNQEIYNLNAKKNSLNPTRQELELVSTGIRGAEVASSSRSRGSRAAGR